MQFSLRALKYALILSGNHRKTLCKAGCLSEKVGGGRSEKKNWRKKRLTRDLIKCNFCCCQNIPRWECLWCCHLDSASLALYICPQSENHQSAGKQIHILWLSHIRITNDELTVDHRDSRSVGGDSSWQTNSLAVETGSLRVQLGARSLILWNIRSGTFFFHFAFKSFLWSFTGDIYWAKWTTVMVRNAPGSFTTA